MTMREVAELREQYYSNQPVPWIDVTEITDANIEKARELNRKLDLNEKDFEEESDDAIIVDCLTSHLLQTRGKEDISGFQLIVAAIYLIEHFWSGAAAFFLVRREFLDRTNVNACVTMIREAFYAQREWLPKSLLRNFCVELLSPYDDGLQRVALVEYLNEQNDTFYQYVLHDREYTSLNIQQSPKKKE